MSSKKMLIILLASLIIGHTIMVVALINGFPQTPCHQGWHFHHGGDEETYFRLAKSFADLEPIREKTALGFPLFLTPFIYLSKATALEHILRPVVIIHTFILFNFSIILIALITEKVTNNKILSGSAAFIWTVYPWIVYLLVGQAKDFYLGGIFLVHHMWLPALTDPGSTFFILLGVYSFLISLEKRDIKYPLFSAIAIGCAALIRPPNALLIILFCSMYLFQRRIKETLCLGLVTFTILLPQFWYNLIFWGKPLSAYMPLNEIRSLFSLKALFGNLGTVVSYAPYLLLSPILIVLGFTRLYKINRQKAVFVLLWFLAYFSFYTLYVDEVHGYDIFSFLRYLIPSYPAYFILLVSCFLQKSESYKT